MQHLRSAFDWLSY